GGLRDGMVLRPVHRAHGVVRIPVHVWGGSGVCVQHFVGMELRVRLWIRLLSLLLSVVGAHGLLRLWMVSALWVGRLGWRSGGQCLRCLGQYGLLAHGCRVG